MRRCCSGADYFGFWIFDFGLKRSVETVCLLGQASPQPQPVDFPAMTPYQRRAMYRAQAPTTTATTISCQVM